MLTIQNALLGSAEVESEKELEDTIRDFNKKAKSYPTMVDLFKTDKDPAMLICLNGSDETILLWNDPEGIPSFTSRSKDHDEGVVIFDENTNYTELSKRFLIKLDDGIKAIKEFLRTNELPSSINWEKS